MIKKLATIIICAVVGVACSGALHRIEGLTYFDLQIAPLPQCEAKEKVAVITIQRETFDRLDLVAYGNVLPRTWHAELLRRLGNAGARTVVFDLLFSVPSPDDEALRKVFQRPDIPPTILLVEPIFIGPIPPERLDFDIRRPAVMPVITPSKLHLGHSLAWEPDGVLRGIRATLRDRQLENMYYPNVASVAVELSKSIATDRGTSGTVHRQAKSEIREEENEIPIRWSLPPSPIEFSNAMSILDAGDSDVFRDAIVIVGATNQGQRLYDMHPTPIGDMSGAQFLAVAIQSVSSSLPPLRVAPLWIEWAISVAVALGVGWVCWHPTLVRLAAGIVLALAGPWVLTLVALQEGSALLSTTRPTLAALISVLITLSVVGYRQLPAWIRFHWGLAEEEMADLFVDLVDSTGTLAQVGIKGAAFMESVNELIARAVDRNSGHIERTIGDGAFAVFRSGKPGERAAYCYAAIHSLFHEFEKRAERFQQEFGVQPVIAVGAEWVRVEGRVLLSRGRAEFSTFGRDISYAARVQKAAASMNSRAAIGPKLRELLGEKAIIRARHELDLQGFGPNSTVFELEIGRSKTCSV